MSILQYPGIFHKKESKAEKKGKKLTRINFKDNFLLKN